MTKLNSVESCLASTEINVLVTIFNHCDTAYFKRTFISSTSKPKVIYFPQNLDHFRDMKKKINF